MTPLGLDLDEQTLWQRNPMVLEALLADRTTGGNILWATDDYAERGMYFEADREITPALVTGVNAGVIRPRIAKSREAQLKRTKGKAEVFTPSWVCNCQNNLIDEAWFGRKSVFNTEGEKSWKATKEPIEFPIKDKSKTWQKYVDEKRLEITCGEAPYLVSRYDTVTGEAIELSERIGLLDRKLRVVSENCSSEQDWLKWARRAVESIYGFEFQGDNLLLARENILMSYQDYREAALGAPAEGKELLAIAKVISWNIWQMDGLTQLPPYEKAEEIQQTLFPISENAGKKSPLCLIRDWRSKKTLTFQSLLNKED